MIWDDFFREKIVKIFTEKHYIVDIGGGLRVDPSKNNRENKANAWVLPYTKKVNYKILDKVPDFHPDIIGDIHALPLANDSVDAVICIAVLEHVEEPQQAVREMYRVLKPGGYCFIYVPFLFYYHPMNGYYKDYYRFTYDGLEYMAREFSHKEIQGVRGPIATIMNLLPSFSKRTRVFEWLDTLLRPRSRQVSGFYAFLQK